MAIQKLGNHEVGNLNSKDVRTVPEVMAGADVDNYTLVELAYDGNGVRKAVPLSDATAKTGYLACAVEILYDNEPLQEFYVANGEYFRVIHLDKGVRFETSAFSGTPVLGQFAHFDPASKKFVLESAESGTAKHTFQIADILTGEYGFGKDMVRLEERK
jgi:hypothetical protein